ncbi:hypothetical protein O6H91_07G022600 [Diphasiastrum complanatum]|uniref:Uncharacterized protein n=1 Tax=Diphasiastrum complanatum TaxID=34168 RepID=A0ACC2D348_DIPCM|nr:hypothetical protein O6H91_07G022600 [Diphasiastrum complanatum]
MDSSSTAAAAAMAASPQPQTFQLSNPFVLRVGQVMTGFGVGCGIGIGVGRPLNLGAIPIINQVVGKGDLFQSLGSTGRHVQNLIRRIGIKNVEAGIGCGVGLGHGFGVGLSLKPGTGQQLLHFFQNVLLSLARHMKLPLSSYAGMDSLMEGSAKRMGIGNFSMNSQTSSTIATPGMGGVGTFPSYPSTVGVQGVGTMEQQTRFEAEVTKAQLEKEILLTLLRHQRRIEELKQELTALQETFASQMKDYLGDMDGFLETTKPGGQKESSEAMFSLGNNNSCSKCFHCRRRMRGRI